MIVFIFGIVAILLLAFAAAWVFLPSQRSATLQYCFHASPEEVWAVYHDPESQPAWRAEIDRVEMHKTSYPRSWTEYIKNGPPITLSELELFPPNRMVLSTQAKGFFTGRYTAQFAQEEGGKTIGTFTESATLTGFIPKLLAALFVNPEKLIENYVKQAEAEIEQRRKTLSSKA